MRASTFLGLLLIAAAISDLAASKVDLTEETMGGLVTIILVLFIMDIIELIKKH